MIDWLFRYLQPLLRIIIRRPAIVLSICLVSAAASFILALNLRIDNDLSKLIPQDYPSVQALHTLREQVGGEHEAAVAIKSPSFEANRQFGRDLIPPALRLNGQNGNGPYFVRAEFRRNIDFLKNNALYFATENELNQLESFLETEIRNAKNEANPFYIDLNENQSTDDDSIGQELNRLYEELVGSEYFMSADSTVLVVKLFPSGAQTDIQFIRNAYADLNQLIARLEPSSYHPEMEVVAAGRMIRTLIEVETITQDVIDSFGTGVLILLTTVILYFFYKSYRSRPEKRFSIRFIFKQLKQVPAHLLIIALPLIISLSWTFGIAYIAYGNLNIMTSTLGLLLFGMGIDFGIHFFARYSEERGDGKPVDKAILTTFMTTGQAIFAVGITTSAAFFILMIADFKGFSEFGFIAGLGLLFSIITYVLFLPALLVILEDSPLLNLDSGKSMQRKTGSSLSEKSPSTERWRIASLGIVGIGLTGTILALLIATDITFQYDFGKLEPTYERYIEMNSLVSEVYSDRRTRNAAYIIVDKPSEALQVADIIRSRAETDYESPTIRNVEIFQDRFPLHTAEVQDKLSRLAHIREMLNDPFLSGSESTDLNRLRQGAAPKTEIPLGEVPEFLKAPFTSTSGVVGNLVIIHPSVGLSDGQNSMNFSDDVGRVRLPGGKIFYAGSTSIVASDMLRLMMAEAPVMILLTIAFIIVFKLLILHRIRWVILALLPLVASFIWLFGLMDILSWQLNFYNLVVLPTILGIGDDSGIHLIHRYIEEDKESISRVMQSTGEHITVSALTTMLGFSGLLVSIHPGMRTIGEVAVLGIGLSLVAAIILLPALLRVMQNN